MTATTTITTRDIRETTTARPRLWVSGLISGSLAAVATTATVLVARAAGEDVAVAGEQIPLAGFAQFVLVGALVGVVLARVLARRAHAPRTTFLRTTVALTALSIVPDAMIDATNGSKLVLALTHVIAAAIIIPALAARLPETA
jgi:hypothetical protein